MSARRTPLVLHPVRTTFALALLGALAACGGGSGGSANAGGAASSTDATARATSASATSESSTTTPADHAVHVTEKSPDHEEFEATLHAPFRGDAATEARYVTLRFAYPLTLPSHQAQSVRWRLELQDAAGRKITRWQGDETLQGEPLTRTVHWDGRAGELAGLKDGLYTLVLHAQAFDAASGVGASAGAKLGDETQSWPIVVGHLA